MSEMLNEVKPGQTQQEDAELLQVCVCVCVYQNSIKIYNICLLKSNIEEQ